MPSVTNTLERSRAPVAILLVLHALLLGWEAWRLGVTFDEPSHLAAAYMYWQDQDVLAPSDTPPLMRILSGWVPRALHMPLRRNTQAWKTQSSFDIGYESLEALDAKSKRQLIFLTRLCFLGFPLLTVWLVWHWGRQLFRETTALALAACAVFEPTLLGHGPLIKSDVASTFGCLLFFYTGWRYWRRPDVRTVCALALALLVAVLSKFTMLVLIPVALLLVACRGPRVAGLALVLGTVYAGIVAAYQFHVQRLERPEIEQMREDGFTPPELAAARILRKLPWPPQFIKGLRFVGKADRGDGFPAYLLGRRIEPRAPYYFPVAWAVKFPIALQILTVAGLIALLLRIAARQVGADDVFIWTPVALMAALLLRSHIHIGFRHALPAIPFLLLGAGFALDRWRTVRIAADSGLLWLVAASLWIYPQGLSYFNEWVGGPRNGWKYLADSNLDWGQNLPELADLMAQRRIDKVHLYYFGLDVPGHFIPRSKLLFEAAPWDPEWEKAKRLQPAPGVYAISVNNLLGYFFSPPYREFFAYFKSRPPDAYAGWSIFVYNVGPPGSSPSPPRHQGAKN